MPELLRYGRSVETVFDLLGTKEDDITYAVGWGLANSERLCRTLVAEAFADDGDKSELTAVRLQQTDPETGRTDIEVESQLRALIVEAKRGWSLPGHAQLRKYAQRLNADGERAGHILVVSECRRDYPPVQALPSVMEGMPVTYMPWSQVAELVAATIPRLRRQAEKRLLRELHRYLRGLMTTQNTTSNLAYVAALNDRPLSWSSLTFHDFVVKRQRYFHPVGRRYPKTPVNYIGFRFRGRLMSIHHVEDYEVVTGLHHYFPEISPYVDWSDVPHFVYTLGPTFGPSRQVRTGKHLYAPRGTWCALDLLQTCETVAEATNRTRERHQKAGIPYPGV
jgi:hypothetical protein